MKKLGSQRQKYWIDTEVCLIFTERVLISEKHQTMKAKFKGKRRFILKLNIPVRKYRHCLP